MNYAMAGVRPQRFNACSSGERGEINEYHRDLYISCHHGSSRNFLASCLFKSARTRTPWKDEYQTAAVSRTKPSDLTSDLISLFGRSGE